MRRVWFLAKPCPSDFVYMYVFFEGPKGVKWELGFACFCTGKMGFRLLGLGFQSEKKSQNGNGIGVLLAYQWDRDTGLGNGIGNPPSGPSFFFMGRDR